MELTTLLLSAAAVGFFFTAVHWKSQANRLEIKANHWEGLVQDYKIMLDRELRRRMLEKDSLQ